MVNEDEGSYNIIGYVVLFSFISVIFLFFSILFFAVLNNYAIGELYALTNDFVISGLIPSSFSSIADTIVSNIPTILPTVDYIWFGAFVSMIISTLIYSYTRPRDNYFNIFTMAVLGIVIFMFLGSYVNQVTTWFITNIYYPVLPTVSTYTPIFNWYLSNLSLINLIIVSLNIIANFVDLDFKKFTTRKEGETIEEI